MSDDSGSESGCSGWCIILHEDVNEDDDQIISEELNVEASAIIKGENDTIGRNETMEDGTEVLSAKSTESEEASEDVKEFESVGDDHERNLVEANLSAVKVESVVLGNDNLSIQDEGAFEQGANKIEVKEAAAEIEMKPEICDSSIKSSVISDTSLAHTECPQAEKPKKYGRVASKHVLRKLWKDLPLIPTSSSSSSNTDSSSDVDILDESAEIPDVDLRSNPMLDSTLRLSAQPFLYERITSSTQAIPDMVTRETQASLVGEATLARPTERRSAPILGPIDWKGFFSRIWSIMCSRENQAFLLCSIVIFLYVLTVVTVILLTIALSCFVICPFQLDKPLAEMNKIMVECLGEQHLYYLANGGNAAQDPLVCKHNTEHYSAVMLENLNWRSRNFLLRIVDDPEDPRVLSYAMNHKDLHLSALVRQLQYFELLPTKEAGGDHDSEEAKETSQAKVKVKELPDSVREMKDVIANLTLANRILREQVMDSVAYNKNDDLIIAKDGLPSIESNQNSQSHSNNLVRDLKTKITWLLIENGKLEKKIHDMRVSQLKGHCTDASPKTVRDVSKSNEEKSDKSFSKDDSAEKIKPYLDELVSSLSGQILNLHSSLSNELKEVKRWNELIENMTMEIRNRSSTAQREETEKWSWQEMRESVENIIFDTHNDIKERINAFQTLDITDSFNNVVEDNKKNAEYMLNLINHYFNAAKEKTQELLNTQMPEINTEAPVEGFWNIMGSLIDKWHYVKGEFKRMAKELQTRQRCQDSHTCGKPEDEVNWYFRKPSKQGDIHFEDHEDSHENWYLKRLRRHRSFQESPYYEKRVKSDWLFKRAAHRAKRRHELEKKIRASNKRYK